MFDAVTRPRFARLAVVLGILGYFVYAASAGAEPTPEDRHAAMAQRLCADGQAIFRSRMAFIEVKLDLKPEQRPAFAAFVDEARTAAEPMRNLCSQPIPPADARASAKLRAGQRLASATAMTLDGFARAAERLEGALSDDQVKALAEAMRPPTPGFGGQFRP